MKPKKPRNKVIISHHQVIRPSKDYSSAEASYGIQFEVDNNSRAIRRGFLQAEKIVEERLVRKFKQQMEILDALSRNRPQQ